MFVFYNLLIGDHTHERPNVHDYDGFIKRFRNYEGKRVGHSTLAHCNVIIGRSPIEAIANTVAIQLPGNPAAYIRNCFTLQ